MKKSFLTSLCALCTLFLIPRAVKANNVTVGGDTDQGSTYLPMAINSGTKQTNAYFSVSQQLYFASELTTASSTTIRAITFYYMEGSPELTRNLRVWMNNSSITAFPTTTNPNFVAPGTKVYSSKKGDVDSGVTLTAGQAYTLTFDTPFEWDGTSNIVVTVFDSTGVKNTSGIAGKNLMIQTTGVARFLHQCNNLNTASVGWDMGNLTASTAATSQNRGYVNKVTFTFEDGEDPEPPTTPTNFAVNAVSTTSATLSWSGVIGATSYDLQQSANGEDWEPLATGLTGTSYNWTELTVASTQYARIRANNSDGSSDWSDAVTVTTDAVHEHDGIPFSKWTSTNSLPTAGSYYLKENVELGYVGPDLTLTGDLNLCLNGKIANLGIYKIIVPDGKTLTIYDNVGGGKITSIVPGQIETFEVNFKAVIVVKSGGTLVLKQGTIENNFVHDPTDPEDHYSSYAICSNGSLHLSGAVLINSNDADIYLNASNIITLDGAISNAEKHTVYKLAGAITSGWSTYMSAADPRDYFESANSGKSVCLNEGEAALRTLLHLSEESQNSGITTNYNQTVDVELTRTLTSAQYNTFCLPFALDNEQLQVFFGSGYDLEELTSSSLEEEILTLMFERKYELEAGKPYLLQPSIEVVNPSFEGVTITANMPDTIETTYADLRAIYRPTELAGDNHNLLFLGEDNTLFWPESTGNMNAFRAYFVVKGAAANAVQARIGRAESQTTAIENQHSHIDNHKYMKDGQFLIERNGMIYNAQGQTIK